MWDTQDLFHFYSYYDGVTFSIYYLALRSFYVIYVHLVFLTVLEYDQYNEKVLHVNCRWLSHKGLNNFLWLFF